MITDRIIDKITYKITDMTSKLQNAQNSKENPDKGIWYTIFCQKKPLTASISCSKFNSFSVVALSSTSSLIPHVFQRPQPGKHSSWFFFFFVSLLHFTIYFVSFDPCTFRV